MRSKGRTSTAWVQLLLMATKKFWTLPPITMLICVFILMFLYFIMAWQPLLDSPLKNHFIGSIQTGKSIWQAAKDHNIAPATANDIYHKYNKTGTTHWCAGSGRPSTVTPQIEHHLKYLAVKFWWIPFGELGKLVEPKVSASTVQKVLNTAGYHQWKAQKVIYLKPEQKAARLQWAKDFRHWKLEDWAQVLYLDEAYVVLGESKGAVYVPRPDPG